MCNMCYIKNVPDNNGQNFNLLNISILYDLFILLIICVKLVSNTCTEFSYSIILHKFNFTEAL